MLVFDVLCRGVALGLGAALTGYGSVLSWQHLHSPLAPLVACCAAALLVLAEHSWKQARRRALLLGALGVVASTLSGLVVADRIAATQAATMQQTRDANLPRTEAERALQDAKGSLSEATAAATAECASGRKKRCLSLEEREEAARQRVAAARAQLVRLGAVADEDHIAALFGEWAGVYRAAMPLALPAWAEITAPLLMAFGLRPWPQRRKTTARRAKPQLEEQPAEPPAPVQEKPRKAKAAPKARLGSSPLRPANVVPIRRHLH